MMKNKRKNRSINNGTNWKKLLAILCMHDTNEIVPKNQNFTTSRNLFIYAEY